MSIGKRTISFLLAVVTLLSITFTFNAVHADFVPYSSELVGIDEYMSMSADGTVSFDEMNAKNDGYSDEAITAVSNQLAEMNNLVRQGRGYIDDEFNLIIAGPSTRAVGESKVVTTWYGLTQIYLNSDEAAQLKEDVGMLTDLSMSLMEIAPYIPTIGLAIQAVSAIGYIQIGLYYAQIVVAEEPGRGIIMNVQQDIMTGGGQSIWIVSQ